MLNIKSLRIPEKIKSYSKWSYCIDGEAIERVTTFKYLGMTLDQNLRFDNYIQNGYNRCCARPGATPKA